jgi:hypothetical protein
MPRSSFEIAAASVADTVLEFFLIITSGLNA